MSASRSRPPLAPPFPRLNSTGLSQGFSEQNCPPVLTRLLGHGPDPSCSPPFLAAGVLLPEFHIAGPGPSCHGANISLLHRSCVSRVAAFVAEENPGRFSRLGGISGTSGSPWKEIASSVGFFFCRDVELQAVSKANLESALSM